MIRLVLGKLAALIPTLIGVTLVAFALIRLIPGDPIEIILETAVGRARVGCDAVRWQGWSREFGQHAARLRSSLRLQAQTRPARATTLRAEPGLKQSIRTVCAWRRPEPLALAHAREAEPGHKAP